MAAPTYSLVNKAIKSEGNFRSLNVACELTTHLTSASTISLTAASALNHVFTGSTSGQIINLGDARNYAVGQEWWLYNDSSAFITAHYSDSTVLYSIPPNIKVKLLLTNNATANGTWSINIMRSGSSSGGLLMAMFSSTANSVGNAFLDTENIGASDTLPAVAPISQNITLLSFTSGGATPSGNIEIRVNTTVGAAAATVTLAGTQTQVASINIPVVAGDKINCKISGGSGVAKPLVKLYT